MAGELELSPEDLDKMEAAPAEEVSPEDLDKLEAEPPPPTESPGPHPLRTDIQVKEPDGAPAPLEPNHKLTAYNAASTTTSADRQVEVNQYAEASGIPPHIAAADLEGVKQHVDQQGLEAAMAFNPSLATYATDPAKAAIAKEDLGPFALLHWGMNAAGDLIPKGLADTIRKGTPKWDPPFWLKAAQDSMYDLTHTRVLQTADALGMLGPEAQKELTAEEQRAASEDYGAHNVVTKEMVTIAKFLPYAALSIGARALGTLAGAVGGGAGGTAAGAETGPGAAATGIAGTVGGGVGGEVLGGAALDFFENFGAQYRYMASQTKPDGTPKYTPAEARSAAAGSSVIVAGLSAGLGGRLVRIIPGADKLLSGIAGGAMSSALEKPASSAAVKAILMRHGEQALAGAMFMTGITAANSAFEEAYSQSKGNPSNYVEMGKRIAETFPRTLVDMTILGGLGGGHEFLQGMGKAKEFQTDAHRFELLAQSAEQSATLKRAPAEFEAMAVVAQGGEPQHAFVDKEAWDTYWQGKKADPAKMAAQVMEDGGKAYAETTAAGGDLAIPLEKALKNLGGTEHLRGLQDDFRLSQDNLSPRQARELLAKKVTAADEAAGAEPAPDDGAERVKDDVATKAISAGEHPQVAEDVASIVAAQFRNLAKAEGKGRTAEELYGEYALGIHRGKAVPPEQALEMAKAAQLEQPGLTDIRAAYEQMPEEERFSSFYVDPNTGVLNKRAFNRLTSEGKPLVAHISVEGTKYVNDGSGHGAGNDLYRTAASALHSAAPEVAKVGGDFLVRVADQGELDAILQKANEAMPEKGFALTGAVGADAKAARDAHVAIKEGLEKSGARAARGQRPMGLEAGKPIEFPRTKASAMVPDSLRQAYEAMTPEERFRAVHIEKDTGLLTDEGFRALPKKAFQATLDLDGLGSINTRLSEKMGDEVLHQFGTVVAELGGQDLDFAHLHGDEYAAQADTQEKLDALFEKIRARAQKLVVGIPGERGGFDVVEGVGFSHGVGKDLDAADQALQTQKQRREATGERGDQANDQRIKHFATRAEAESLYSSARAAPLGGGGGALPGGEAAPSAAGAGPGAGTQEVEREVRFPVPEGGDFKLEKHGERGFITFSPPDGGKPRRFNIHLLANSDRSTLAHETMHFLSHVLGDLASRPDAPPELKADYQTILTQMGYGSHEERLASMTEARDLKKLEIRTPEQEASLKELSAKEERVTHAWEQYLAEGKSPSLELAGVFSRFRNWMARIYRGVQNIGRQFRENFGEDINLSPEVRGVFDRLLASEDEVRKAQDAQEAAKPFTPALESMTPEERAEYDQVSSKATDDATTELVRRIAHGQRAENSKFMLGERARFRTEAEQELDQKPAYRTLQNLQEAAPAEKLNRADVVRKYSKELADSLPKELFAPKGEGANPEAVAALQGWTDAQEMLRTLAATTPREQVLVAEVQRRMEELYGPPLLDNHQELSRLAMDAVHTPAAARKAQLELNAMRRMLREGARDAKPPDRAALEKLQESNAKDKAAAQAEAQRQQQLRRELTQGFSDRSAKDLAEVLVGAKRVGDITASGQGLPGQYLRAERKAAKGSLDAAAKGDLLSAIALKEQQVLNGHLYRQATDLREELTKGLAKLKGSGKDAWRVALGRADPAYREAHDSILQALGLQQTQPGAPKPSLNAFVTKAASDAQDLAFDIQGLRDLISQPKPWAQLTVDDARNVMDAVKSIRHMANDLTEVQLGGRRTSRDALFTEMEQSLAKRPAQPMRPRDAALEGKLASARKQVQSIDAQLLTPESLITMADAHSPDGPFREAFLDVAAKASMDKRAIVREVGSKIVDAFNNLPKKLREKQGDLIDLSKDLPLDQELKRKLGDGPVTRSYLWMIALNMGNEGNKQRLLDGYGWTEQQVQSVLAKHMTKPEWDFAQKVWDSLESLRPRIAAQHEAITGLPLGMVEASPVETPFGEYKGGYFPAREEPRARTSQVHHNAEVVADIFGESYRRPSVAAGHTKGRVEKADYYINLNWSVVPAHVAQVAHDLAWRQPVRQMASLMLDPRFRDMVDGRLGAEYGRQLIPWVQGLANASEDSVPAHVAPGQQALNWFRNRAVRQQLGVKMSSLAKHYLDPAIGAATGVTGVADTAMAMARATSGMAFPEMRRFALENSKELQSRSDSVTRDLTQQLKDIGQPRKGVAGRTLQVLEHGANEVNAVFHESMDKFVTTQTWTAKYTESRRQGAKDGLGEAEAHAQAVGYADDAVRKIYPSSEAANAATALRRKDWIGVSLMYFGFANKVWNLERQAFDKSYLTLRDPEAGLWQKVKAPSAFAAQLLAMSVLGAGTKILGGQGKQDDEDHLQFLERTMLAEPFSTLPVVGPVAESASTYLVTGRKERPRINGSVVGDFAEDLWANLTKSHENESDEEKTLRYLETALRLPLGAMGAAQIHTTGDYLRQLYTGEVDPRGPLDVASGVAYGKHAHQGANPLSAAQDILSE